jgi:endonuclease G
MKKHFLLWLIASGVLILSGCKKDALDTEPEIEIPEVPTTPPVVTPPVTPPATYNENESLYLGNPSNAVTDINTPGNYLMDETYYALSYNESKGIANWVSWHVHSDDIGSVPRQDDFRANPRIPSGWYSPNELSYSGSGFDRGHMCPSSDRTATYAANSSTFLMTNMIPQAPVNNQVVWANLESYCRSLVDQGSELYIIAGGSGSGGVGNNGSASTIDNGNITVPAYVWKTILVIPTGTDDLDRIGERTRIISVLIPNDNSVSNNWRNYRVSVDELETLTGFDFFSRVPQNIQDVIEAAVDNL